MKISHFTPRALAGKNNLDNSRLGNHVRSIFVDDLPNQEHGIVILGLADDTGIRNVGGRLGAAAGPRALREKLYQFTTGEPRLHVYDLGDLTPAATIEKTHRQATSLVRAVVEAGHEPLVIGGGHDLGFPHALGVLEGQGERSTLFVNIDAHLDLRPATEKITSGSPWFLLREHKSFQQSRSRIEEFGLQRHCNAHSLVSYAKKHRIPTHWLPDIRATKKSADLVFRALLAKRPSLPQVISFDIDSVQWSDAPGCSAPQNLGFTAAEAIALCFAAGAQKKVQSFGLFELSPPLDPDGRTASLAAHCVRAYLEGRGAW